MKKNHTRGMRDISTIQGLRRRSLSSTREQTVADLARLEHEKARLKRELGIWIDNQKRAEGRLRHVEERLALLQQSLDPPDSGGSKKHTQVRRSTTDDAGGGEDEVQEWREIPLAY